MLHILQNGTLYGLKNDNGDVIVQPVYHTINFVDNKQFCLCKSDGYYDCINENGDVFKTLNFRFISQEYFSPDEFLLVSNETDEIFWNDGDRTNQGKKGLLDIDLNVVLEPVYNLIDIKSNCILLFSGDEVTRDYTVEDEDNPYSYYGIIGGKWGASDLKGNVLIPLEYDFLQPASNDGVFLANKGGTMIYSTDEHGMGGYSVLGGKWGVIDFNNMIIKEVIYDDYQHHDEKIVLEKYYLPQGDYILINGSSGFDTFYFKN